MTTHLIAATGESTGKTAVALALALIFRERNGSVGYMKPKGSRLELSTNTTRDSDAVFAKTLLDLDADIDVLEPIVYSRAFIEDALRGNKDPADLRSLIRERFARLAQSTDHMIVEGGTTVASGGVIELPDAALADLVDAQVVLVTSYRSPSDIDTLLSATEIIGGRLAGVLFNGVRASEVDQVTDHVLPFLDRRGIPVYGVLPRVTELAGATISDFANELEAEVLTNIPTDTYIERVVVGAMGADASLRYFRRTTNAVVITGGDRSDIHTVALEAPGVNCLCLTGGYRPSSAVVGKAEERGVPIVLVPGDTLTTIERAERILRSGRVRDEQSVTRMQSLLKTHVDIQAILGAD